MAASSLLEAPISFARETKTSFPSPPKWLPPLCCTKSPLRPPISNPGRTSIRAQQAAAVSKPPPSSPSQDGKYPFGALRFLFTPLLETLTASNWPSIAALLLGAFLTVADPCAASCQLVHSSSSWRQSCTATATSPFGAHTDVSRATSDGSSLLIMMGSSLAVVLLLPLRVQSLCKRRSLQKVLDQICQDSDTSTVVALSYVLADVYTERTFFCNQLGASGLFSVSKRGTSFQLNPLSYISTELKLEEFSFDKKHVHLMKAVATVNSKFLLSSSSESADEQNNHFPFSSNLDSKMLQSSKEETTPEIDEREKLRRMRISKANKGNVPWNKGKKLSAETIRRIRERTRLAMQDPKVKMKLVKSGNAMSEERKIKIGVGVREGWRRRRQKRMMQEGCVFEWQNIIAEAAREGSADEDELLWDSYKILGEQLKQEWLESVERRRTMPRPKGSRRVPKSPEQRRKISEAISAKWADPEYRDRVCSAFAKYHGSPVGAERRQRRKASGGMSLGRDPEKKKPTKSNIISHEAKSIMKEIYMRKRTTPMYKDPMASSKLEMIKKIRAQREDMATKKREATERAKLLVAEAEKAARALEVVALKNPLAQASLLETRKLIAEARWSIENIESEQLTSQGTRGVTFVDSDKPINHLHNSPGNLDDQKWLSGQLVNGTYLRSSSESNHKDLQFGNLTPPAAPNGRELMIVVTKNTGEISGDHSLLHNEFLIRKSAKTDNHMVFSQVSESIRHKNLKSEEEELNTPEVKNSETSKSCLLKTKKKWVRGRLVEVEEDDDSNGGVV